MHMVFQTFSHVYLSGKKYNVQDLFSSHPQPLKSLNIDFNGIFLSFRTQNPTHVYDPSNLIVLFTKYNKQLVRQYYIFI